jgi:HAE1 family hydrophobic/amphiphilic exporter-1
LVALTLALLPRAEWGQARGGGKPTWDVIIEHFGVDSEEIERSITVPLESEMARLQGVTALRSVSEFGKSRVTAELAEGADSGAFFLELSDAVDRVEATLPSSAQKPRIVSSGGQSPSFIAALEGQGTLGDFRDWMERTVKPSLERRPGVGEVEVGGGQPQEVHVVVDEARAASSGLSFDDLAQALQTQDSLLPAGTLRGSSDRTVSVRGRLADLENIAAVRVPLRTGSIPLGALSRVAYAGREADTMSRLDGDERVVLLVHAAGTANLVSFSRQMRDVLADLKTKGVSSRIILDEGKVLEDALGETLRALLEGLTIVLVVLPLVLPSLRNIAALALVLPLSLAATIAVLAAAGIPIDRFVLAGFAVGLGAVLDFALLVCRTPQKSLAELLLLLFTALVTTLLFLAPLAFLDFVWPGIKTLVVAVGLLLVIAFVLTALFVPLIRGGGIETAALARLKQAMVRRFGRSIRRAVQAVLAFSTRRARLVAVLAGAVAAAAVAAVVVSGVQLGGGPDTPELTVHVEYESEASLVSVDARTQTLVARLKTLAGVTGVQSLARPGSADLTVTYGGAGRQEIAAAIVAAGRDVPGAFVYLPQPGSRTVSVQVSLSGDDNATLRSLAKQAAKALAGAGFEQVVLNFKDAPRRLAVLFDPAKMDRAGLSAAGAATSLRWNLWGPVAVKWVTDRERDVRVMGATGRVLTRTSLMTLPLKGPRGETRVGNVAHLVEENGGAKIYHENRQRAVYLTVQTQAGSARTIVHAIDAALRPLEWPTGYVFRVDPRLADEEDHFTLVAAALGLSLVLIGLLFGARTQSLGAPLLTLAMVPVALAFPVGAAALSGGFTVPVVLALVLSGGTVVNNAILIVDAARSGSSGVRRAVRRRLSALAITNLAALLGAFPLALAGQGGLLSTLALVVAATALGAFGSTLTAIPALLTLFPSALKPLVLQGGGMAGNQSRAKKNRPEDR